MSRHAYAKDQIVNALVELLLEKGPEADVPVKELISRAGVNRSTYYYHFRKVDDVVEYLMEQFLSQYTGVLENYGSASVRMDGGVLMEGSLTIVTFVYEHRDAFSALQGSWYGDVFRQRIVDATRRSFEGYEWYYLNKQGVPTRLSDMERQYYSWYAGYSFYSFIECWARRSFQEDPKELVATISRLFSIGLTWFDPARTRPR